MNVKKLIAILSTSFITGTACASMLTPGYDWSGLYVGGNLGEGFDGHNQYTFGTDNGNNGNYAPSDGGTLSQTFAGLIGGLQVGENWQIHNIVLGIETGFDWLNFSQTTGNTFQLDGDPTYTTKMNWLYTATPRLGYAQDNFLFYTKGGIAVTSIETELANNSNDTYQNAPSHFSQSQTALGWTLGAGVNYAKENWILGVEYNYFDFGNVTYGGNDTPDRPDSYANYPIQYQVHTYLSTITATVAYKF